MPSRRITLEINLNSGTTVRDVRNISDRFAELQERMRQITTVSQQLGTGIDQTEALLSALGISAEQASQAITGLLLEQQGLRQVGETIASLGLTQTQGDVLGAVLGSPGDIQNYIDQLNGLNSSLDALTDIASIIGGSIREAEDFIQQLGLSAEDTAEALRRIQAGQSIGASRDTQRRNLRDLGLNDSQADALLDRVDNGLRRTNRGAGNLLGRIGELSFAFNNVLTAVQTLAAAGQEAFQLLILSNEQLKNEILSTQASIAATTDVVRNGQVIDDPRQAVLALEQPIAESIKRIRKETLDLVGVTSAEVLQVFNILASNTGALANQSQQFPDGLIAAEKLTKSFTAALGNLQLPLNQANQEVNSILSGQIDTNSVLAKRLGITNEQVRQYRASGTLVDELNKKLESFVIANAEQARSISGITSNLKDIQEIAFREAGEDLYEDIVDQLERVYKFVQDNQEVISSSIKEAVDFLRQLLNTILEGVEGIAEKLTPTIAKVGETFKVAAEEGAGILLETVEQLFLTVNSLLSVLEPLLTLLNKTLTVLNDTGLTEIVVQTGALYFALTGIGAVLKASIIPSLTKFATTITTTAIPAVIGWATSMQAAIATAGGLKAAILAASVSIAPLIPLIAGLGIAIAGIEGIKLGAVNDTLDAYSTSVKNAGDETFNYAVKLKELNDIQKENGTLTEEEQKRRENLINISKQLIEQNENQIKELKEFAIRNKDTANSVKALIQQLEISNNALEKQAGVAKEAADNIKILPPELDELGAAYDQLGKRVDNSISVVQRGTGKLVDAQKAAKEAISETQKLLEANVISTEEAIANFQIIASNTRLTYEEQLAGQKAIFDAISRDLKRTNEDIKQLENERLIELQQLLNDRLITEAEFNQQRQELTTQRIRQELQQERDRIARIKALEEEEQIDPTAAQEQIRQALQKTGELQLQLLQQEKSERESIINLIQDNLNREAAVYRRTRSEVISGLKQQQSEITKNNALIERRVKAEEAIARQVETQTRLIQSQAEVQKAQQNLQTTEFDIRLNELRRSQEIRQRLESGEVKTRRERIELTQELNRLGGTLARTDRDIAIEIQEIEKERRDLIKEAQQEEEARARRLLELDIQRQEATARRAVLEAEIAANQARSSLNQAQQTELQSRDRIREAETGLDVAIESGDEEKIAQADEALRLAEEQNQRDVEAIGLAGQSIEFANESVEAAKEQLEVQETLSFNQREALDLQQQAALAQRNAEARARGQAEELERGARAAVRLATALNSTDLSKFGIVELQQRFKGGIMEAGQPYFVGEDPRTGKLLPSSEIIVPDTTSYAIASSKAREWINAGIQQQITNNSYTSNTVKTGNESLIREIQQLRTDLQSLNTGTTNKIESMQFINQLTRADNKAEANKFVRDLANEVKRSLEEF